MGITEKRSDYLFSLKLYIYRHRRNVIYWLMGKLDNKINKYKSIEDMIYKDILHTFAYNENGYYRLYMKKSPIGYLDLEKLIQDERGDYVPVNEIDLNYTYDNVLDHIMFKFALNPSVKVCTYNKDNNKYFEVYWKNYKQTIK